MARTCCCERRYEGCRCDETDYIGPTGLCDICAVGCSHALDLVTYSYHLDTSNYPDVMLWLVAAGRRWTTRRSA